MFSISMARRWGDHMDGVSKTLYLPLYGKAYVSRKGVFLQDRSAEQIWDAEGFPLKGKSGSKWLAYYLGIRAAVYDRWTKEKMEALPEAVVIHIGCGLDSRVLRVGTNGHKWYDIDLPDVVCERKRYYRETSEYRMLSGDARAAGRFEAIPERDSAIVIMEGLCMYLPPEELRGLIGELSRHFDRIALLMDHYSIKAARLSKYRNPVNDVGVTQVYGTDDPIAFQNGGCVFKKELDMTPGEYIGQLSGAEKYIFKKLYAGRFARKLYRLYEFGKESRP